jgi:inhibitor of cysteine peptidase
MKRTAAVALGLLVIAVVVGIAGASAGEGHAATVDASDSGSQIDLAVGETLTVNLESNPTTGFQWLLRSIGHEGVLGEAGHEYVMDTTMDPPPPGTAGVEIWTFTALAEGETTISMEYSRPWDGGEKAVQTFELTVVVS